MPNECVQTLTLRYNNIHDTEFCFVEMGDCGVLYISTLSAQQV